MRVSRGASAALALGVSVVLALTGCGGDTDGSGGSPGETGRPTPSAAASDDADRLGGADTGFSVELPDGWVEINLTADDLVADALAAGLPDELAEDFPQMVGQIADLGGVFALDVPSTNQLGGDFAVNVNGYCVAGAGVLDLASLADLNREQLEGFGAQDVALTDTTLGTTEAVRVTYLLSMGPRPVQGVQFVFLGADAQACFLTFSTTSDDEDLDRFDAIAGTLQLS